MSSLAVWGDKAQVTLTKGFNPQNILIAAAEFQQGRVVVFTGTQYTQKFLSNDASVMILHLHGVLGQLQFSCP